MSFILDALRKSETERQRQAVPGLADAGYRPPMSRRGIWVPLLAVALAANLALMAGFWWGRRNVSETEEPARPVLEDGARNTGPVVRRSTGPGNALARVAGIPPMQPATVGAAPEPKVDTGDSYTEVFEPPPDNGEQPAGADEPVPQTVSTGSRILTAELPTATELSANGVGGLPPLHLDIHVFAATPGERFVYINMKKYTEGALLAEGPRVEEITAEGVVLSHEGRRFLLTRE